MNATEPLTLPAESSAGDDDLTHVFCRCDPDTGLCGADIATHPMNYEDWDPDEEPDLCIVCADLLDAPCERCGMP